MRHGRLSTQTLFGLSCALLSGSVGCAGVGICGGHSAPEPQVQTLNLAAQAPAVENAEIVLLQHVSAEQEATLKRSYESRLPYMVVHRSEDCVGLAVMSRWPILEREVVQAMARGRWYPALRVVVDAPGGPLQVLAMHPLSKSRPRRTSTARLSSLRRDLASVVMSSPERPHARVVAPGAGSLPVVAVFGERRAAVIGGEPESEDPLALR